MSQHGQELLTKIFNKWQANPTDSEQVSIPITRSSALSYFQADHLDDKEALHAYLRIAERAGCIDLKWGRFTSAHLLERITLRDGVKLAGYLDLSVASVEAENARRELQPELSGAHPWIVILLDEMVELWRIGKPAHGLRVQQRREARELLRALESVCAGRQDGLDQRTFSAKYVGDSKAMERMQSRFARIWQRQYSGDDLDPDELFQSLGLSKFPHPVLFKGPITILSRGVKFECAKVRPYIGFPPQAVDSLEFPSSPSYLLTIENLASFNRHVAEVEDEGLVLYTGGFPSSNKTRLFQLLDEKLPESVRFYHWGDLDLGGLRIMARIQDFLRRRLHPHLMTRELLEEYGEPNENISRSKLLTLGSRHVWLMPLVDLILSFDQLQWLEQENVDPSAPPPGN
jgi:hypothetical protein